MRRNSSVPLRGCLRWLGQFLDLNKAHAACAQRRHFGVIAINGNLYSRLLRCRPDQRSSRNGDGNVVYGQVYKFVFFHFWHIFLPFQIHPSNDSSMSSKAQDGCKEMFHQVL